MEVRKIHHDQIFMTADEASHSRASEKPVHQVGAHWSAEPTSVTDAGAVVWRFDFDSVNVGQHQAANEVYTTAEILIYHCYLSKNFRNLENSE